MVERGAMPPRKERERPADAEKAILKTWIEAGAPDFPVGESRPIVSTKAVLRAIRDHLRGTREVDRPYLRYFTLAHLHNQPRVTEADLNVQRAALSKALNSLSQKPAVVLPEVVGKSSQTVLVVDIRKLGWDRQNLWREVLRVYPYGLRYLNSRDEDLHQLEEDLGQLAQRELVYVRADWFVATATRPPLYHTLLRLPANARDLERELGVSVEDNFRSDSLARAGLAKSGVSGQNRLVERHEAAGGGYYWKSYDFRPRRPRSFLTRFPLGPALPEHPFPRQAFEHDGGEIIFSLPNGLQGYLLVDGKDNRIDEGPTAVVSDSLKTSGTAAIVTGTSCMACHKNGLIPFTDQVRNGTAIEGDARRKVERLYPPAEEMSGKFKADEERYLAALQKAVGPFLLVGADKDRPIRELPEPVGEVARTYALVDLGATEAALELGLEKLDSLPDLIRALPKLRRLGLGPLASGGLVKREEWEVIDGVSLFQEAARELGLGTPYLVP
jgi:serine/threonine-protein kinase